MNDKAIIRKLFIAIPELSVDIDFLKTAVSLGLIAQEDLDAAHRVIKKSKKAERFRQKLRNKDVVQRLVVVANELFSVQTVNLLRRTNLLDAKTGHAMRIAARAGKRIAAGSVADETILARGARVFGVLFSRDVVDLVKLLDDEQVKGIANKLRDIAGKKRLSSQEAAYIRGLLLENTMKAERIRGSIKLGRLLAEAFQDARNAQTLVQALAVFGGTVWDHRLVQALARARLITPQQANTLYVMVDLGMDAWRRVAKSFEYSSWAARALMISQGFLTPETIALAKQFGWIDERQARYMYLSANAIRAMVRAKIAEIENLPGRKYRQVPGKNPIQVFANASKHTDAQILKLIAEASRDSSKAAEKLALQKGFGAKTRGQQERIVAAKLHEEMRILWENVGHMTIFGEKQAAAAAVDAMDNLHSGLFDGKDIQKMMSAAGRGGVDSYISRQENLINLSEMVYSNWHRSRGHIDKEINKSLLRGQSAKEMADNVSRYINPNTPGGLRYAAMRLSRTEINNAFQLSSIRYTREMPWVRGYKWNLSSSHGKPDICNDYADRQNKMGKGVYGKSEIPNKPHPHCFCYVTTVVDKFGDFERGLKSGKYDRYLNQMADEGMPLGTGAGSIRFSNAAVWAATRVGAAAAPVVMTGVLKVRPSSFVPKGRSRNMMKIADDFEIPFGSKVQGGKLYAFDFDDLVDMELGGVISDSDKSIFSNLSEGLRNASIAARTKFRSKKPFLNKDTTGEAAEAAKIVENHKNKIRALRKELLDTTADMTKKGFSLDDIFEAQDKIEDRIQVLEDLWDSDRLIDAKKKARGAYDVALDQKNFDELMAVGARARYLKEQRARYLSADQVLDGDMARISRELLDEIRPGAKKGFIFPDEDDIPDGVIGPGYWRYLYENEKDLVQKAFSVFPKEWQNYVRDDMEYTAFTFRDRGYNGGGEIAISGGMGGRRFFGTAVHEIAHSMEGIPGIKHAEDFYWRRRGEFEHGVDLDKRFLVANDGGFFPDEYTNQMRSFYSMKRYKIDSIDNPGHFELLSTGLEELLGTGNIDGYLDDDFEDFLWGVLLWF
jgi:hypothetical protein